MWNITNNNYDSTRNKQRTMHSTKHQSVREGLYGPSRPCAHYAAVRQMDNRFVPLFGQYNYNNRAEWRVTPRYSLTLCIRLKRIVYTTAPPVRGCLVNVGRVCECARAGPRAATKIRLKATLNKLRQWAKLRGSAGQMFSDYCARTSACRTTVQEAVELAGQLSGANTLTLFNGFNCLV